MRDLFKVVISGIAIGIAVLMLGYVGIYYVSGEGVFIQEIALLGQIKTLQSQLLITGISGMLIAVSMYYIEKTMSQQKTNDYKLVLGVVFLTVAAIIAMMLIERMNQNISDMMIILSATFVCAYALLNCVRTFLHDFSLSINKKKNENKENDTQEPEKGNQ